MDEQKPLENKQGEPGEKTEKSEYSFMQETIKDENSRGKKCRKDLLRMAGLGVVFGVCACISFSALKPWLDKKFPGDSQEVVIPKEKEEDNTELGYNDLLKVIRDEFEEEISLGKISQSTYKNKRYKI